MTAASIPLVKTILTTNHIISNRILKHCLAKLPDWINAGKSLKASVQKTNLFSLQIIQLLHISENLETLNEML